MNNKKVSFFSAVLLFIFLTVFSCSHLFTDNIKNTPQDKPDKPNSLNRGTVLFTGTVTDILPKSGAVPADIARLVSSDDAYGRYAMPTKPTSGISYTVTAKTDEKAANGTDPLKTANGVVSTSDGVTYSIPLATGYKWIITVTMKATVDDSSVDVLSDSFTMQTPLSAGSVLTHDFCLKPLPIGNGGIDLSMSADSTLGINSVVVKGLPSTDETLSLNNGGFRLNKEEVAAGVHDVTLLFKNNNKLVYYTTQTINVFPNLTTDKWVSDGSSGPISNGTFQVTRELLQAFAQTQLFVGTSSYGIAAAGNPGTPYEPFQKLSEALNYIKNNGDSTKDYTIHISGTQQGNFSIDDNFNDKMKTLTLCGMTGNTTDILDGSPNNVGVGGGTVLIISTTKPVTIKNLKITGGTNTGFEAFGGGISIHDDATVTLANGAVITGNKATNGGGVYNGGTLFMYGSAVIGHAGANTEASSESNCSNCAGYGGGLYNDSNATAYLGYSAVNTPLELTGGICFNYSQGGQAGAVYNKGVLKMNSGRISYNGSDGYTGGVTSDGSSSNFELSGGAISYNRTYAPNNSSLYAGGVRISSSGSRFTMTGGEISWNESNNGGGVSIIGGVVTFTGGVIKNNTAQKGSGIILESGTLNIGGSAVVASGNDIWLNSSQHITITSTLTPPESAGGKVATITPASPAENLAVLVKDDDVSDADFAAACRKIAVTGASYYVGSDGKLKSGIITTGANAATAISGITATEGTIQIIVTGEITEDNISSIKENLKTLFPDKPSVSISLDLSSTTGLTTLPEEAFRECYSFTSVKLPYDMTTIEAMAFYNCTHLTSVTLPDNLTSIGNMAFVNSDIKTLVIPNGVTTIGFQAFNQCNSLEYAVIPSSVTKIEHGAFLVCSVKIVTFELPDTTLSIEYEAFDSSSLTTVNFLGSEAQKNEKVTIDSNNSKLNGITWCYFVSVAGTTITGAVTGSDVFIDGREVTINSMYVCDHEVTQAEYQAIMGSNPSYFKGTPADGEIQENRPIENVGWYAAIAYCNKKSAIENLTPCYTVSGITDWANFSASDISLISAVTCDFNADGYRLPTEAEWEYIARERNSSSISVTSSNFGSYEWYSENSDSKTHEVKKKYANALGIYDMGGNVYEWCWDWYTDSITAETPSTGPDSSSNNTRVSRGYCFEVDDTDFDVHRGWFNFSAGDSRIGFRVVRTASEIPGTVTCTVTFNSNGGTAVANQNVVSGACAVAPTAPTNALLNFGGWYTTATPSGSDTPFNFTTPITGNITLYAKWNSDFVFVEGTYFDGSAAVSVGTDYASQVFIAGRELAIQNMYVCDHEVTQKEYENVMGKTQAELYTMENGSAKGIGDKNPVYHVSWYAALTYCNKRSIAEQLTPCYTISGITDAQWANLAYSEIPTSNNDTWNAATCNFNANGYRLPTEAEWEYLARGGSLTGTQTKYSGSENLDAVAWYKGISEDITHEVRTKAPNTLGIYDMNGNVWEWCWDRTVSDTDTGFAISADTPSTGAGTGSCHIVRGGSYHCAENNPYFCNVYARGTTQYFNGNGTSGYDKGFRVVRTAVNETNHTVTYDTKGGTEIASQNVWDGYYLPKPATPSKALLNFGGWYSDAACTTSFDFSTPITSNTTLYAKWNSDFVFVEGTYFNGSATVGSGERASKVFIQGRELVIPDLYVCDHEVTQGEYVAVMGTNPSHFNGTTGYEPATGETQANRPVEMVSWYGALVYCNKRSRNEGLNECYSIGGSKNPADWGDVPTISDATWNAAICDFNANGYRLPTEAEWEYIARCADGLTGPEYFYSGTNSLDELTNYAWHSGNSDRKTHEVKKKAANTLGLYDMTGNVWEWCWDWASPTSIPQSTGFSGAVSGTTRVLRGNSWYYIPNDNTVIRLGYYNPCGYDIEYSAANGANHGFRVVRSASYVFHDSVTMLPSGTDGTAGTTGTYALFGDWPQTIATGVTVDESKTLTMGGFTYCKGSDGNWYAKVTANPYIGDDSDYTCSDGTTLENGTEYWFKVEPIKWRVVTTDFDHDGDGSTDDGKRLLLAENVLTSNVQFYLSTNSHKISGDTIESNNYKYSTIRAYLNGSYESNDTQTPTYSGNGFLQSAFTGVAQTYIVPTTVDGNSDKVFILSKDEANSTYFTAENRKHDATDYAKANHANQKNGVGCWWWLRTAGNSTYVCRVYNNGNLNESNPSVTNTRGGVVPALCLE